MKVPRPLPGHWENVRLGRAVQQVPLPEAEPGVAVELLLRRRMEVFEGGTPTEATLEPRTARRQRAAQSAEAPQVKPAGAQANGGAGGEGVTVSAGAGDPIGQSTQPEAAEGG